MVTKKRSTLSNLGFTVASDITIMSTIILMLTGLEPRIVQGLDPFMKILDCTNIAKCYSTGAIVL